MAEPAEDAHAAVREIIDSGLAKLKEWLDVRMQQQEDLIRCLSKNQEPQPARVSHSMPILDKQVGNGTHAQATEAGSQSVSEYQAQDTTRGSQFNSEGPDGMLRVSSLLMPLPGCPPERPGVRKSGADSESPGGRKSNAGHRPSTLSNLSYGRTSFAVGVSQKQSLQFTDVNSNMSSSAEQSRRMIEHLESARGQMAAGEKDWQAVLMEVFDQLDSDHSGCIDYSELRDAFEEVGMPDVEFCHWFQTIDHNGNGNIDRLEWLHLIAETSPRSDEEKLVLGDFLQRLVELQKTRGRIYSRVRRRRIRLILHHDSSLRMIWDTLVVVLLVYISVSVPYSLGFHQSRIIDAIDRCVDVIFCFDVLLNFRTSYTDHHETVVVDGRKIAMRYLKSWFLLDFLTSVPFDWITMGLLPNLTPGRLLKIGKITRIAKLLKISKLATIMAESELMERFDQQLTSRAGPTLARIVKLASIAFLVAHWLACFGNMVDSSSLDDYFSGQIDRPTTLQKYLAGFYWAMTTLSTVGYGDITPKSDEERAYAIVTMVIGGSLYGYVIGSVTSIVTESDVHAHHFHEKMEHVQSWLDSHDEIPRVLRRRVHKHFKRALAERSVMSDSAVIHELSPELCADTACFLIHDHVRHHPMFYQIPNSALPKLLEVVQKNHAHAKEFIVHMGDPGMAMYVLVHGLARYDQGTKWLPPDADPGKAKLFEHIVQGESFGEEILFGLAETYSYSIMTLTDCDFHAINNERFRHEFQHMPELHDQMHAAFLKFRGGNVANMKKCAIWETGRNSEESLKSLRSNGKSTAKQSIFASGADKFTRFTSVAQRPSFHSIFG